MNDKKFFTEKYTVWVEGPSTSGDMEHIVFFLRAETTGINYVLHDNFAKKIMKFLDEISCATGWLPNLKSYELTKLTYDQLINKIEG